MPVMDFMRLIVLMFIELLHTSHQVNDHPDGINNLLDKLIKDTESRFSYNKTSILKEKNNKNLNDSKIVYLKTQVKPDILLKSNVTQKSSEENTHLEDRNLAESNDDEIKTFREGDDIKNDHSKSEHKPSSRRTYDGIHNDDFFSEIIEENLTNIEEDEDMIFEKEITYDITEHTLNHSEPIYQLSSLIDAVTRSGSRNEEDVDKMADMDEDVENRDPQSNGENISQSDVKKILNSYNIRNDLDKGNRDNNTNSDVRKLFSLFKSKRSHDTTSQKPQPDHSESFNRPPILESGFEEVFGQIINNEKLKSILDSLKLDESQQSVKTNEKMLPEVDIRKVEENMKILEEWNKRYNIFERAELKQNITESKQHDQPHRPKEHQNYDINRSGFRNIPKVQGRLYQVPKAHFMTPLSNPRFIFPTKNKIKCCTHTNVIANPLLGILPTERLGLINSVNRMSSGFVYNPLFYPY